MLAFQLVNLFTERSDLLTYAFLCGKCLTVISCLDIRCLGRDTPNMIDSKLSLFGLSA